MSDLFGIYYLAPSGGRRENCWGISCEKSRFYAKKSYVFQLPREARKCLRYFVWKITILRQKIIFFSNFRGGARRVRAPLDPPLPLVSSNSSSNDILYEIICHQYNSIAIIMIYCENTIIRWYQFSWFLQNALISLFLNSWFQTLHATIHGKIVFRWILVFVV
jgi:hypothetical protein